MQVFTKFSQFNLKVQHLTGTYSQTLAFTLQSLAQYFCRCQKTGRVKFFRLQNRIDCKQSAENLSILNGALKIFRVYNGKIIIGRNSDT